jgi:outer membrane lipoprotein-sorting protein
MWRSRRTATACLLLLLLGTAVAARAQQAEAPPSAAPVLTTWYAQAMASTEIGISMTHFWSKGPKLRAETVIVGRRIVTIVNGDSYMAYDALLRRGVAIDRAAAAIARDAPDRRPFGREVEQILRQGGELVGEERLGGRLCDVYRETDRHGRRQLWVSKDELHLPMRLQIFQRSRSSTVRTDYMNWQRGLPITDAFFEPEQGIYFERFTFAEYSKRFSEGKPVGSVPVLYTDLLVGR